MKAMLEPIAFIASLAAILYFCIMGGDATIVVSIVGCAFIAALAMVIITAALIREIYRAIRNAF